MLRTRDRITFREGDPWPIPDQAQEIYALFMQALEQHNPPTPEFVIDADVRPDGISRMDLFRALVWCSRTDFERVIPCPEWVARDDVKECVSASPLLVVTQRRRINGRLGLIWLRFPALDPVNWDDAYATT